MNIVTSINAAPGISITNIATVEGGGPDVPAVTDNGNLVVPTSPPLPNTGGGPAILLQWAPTMFVLGLAMVIISRRRRDQELVA